MKNLKNITLDTVDGNYILKLVWYNGPVSENLAFYKRSNPSIQKPQAKKIYKYREQNNRVDIQFNNERGSFIINTGCQESDNNVTPPPSLLLHGGNISDKIEYNNKPPVYAHEEQIQTELNNIIENLMGKLAEEFLEEVYKDAPIDVANNDNTHNLECERTPLRT